MIDILRESLNMQQCIFGGVVCGDFLLVVAVWLLLERRKEKENAGIRKVLTGFPPDSDSDEDTAKRVRESRENMEAWTRLQNYSAANAYGTEDGG